MVVEMSDENDDLNEFARLFGAKPETPPEGLLPPVEATPTASVPPSTAGSPGDPLAWLLSDEPATAVFPTADAYPPAPSYPTAPLPYTTTAFPSPAAAFPSQTTAFSTTPAPAVQTQVLPTRRSVVAAEAAAAAGDTGRRNLIILGSIGAVVVILIIVLVVVLVAKSGSSGSPDSISRQSAPPSPSSSSTPSATPTPTPSATETPTPTPTAPQALSHTAAPPAPTVTAAVSGLQPDCSSGSQTTFTIGYTSTNAANLNLTSSDGSVNTNITPAASGTIPAVLYQCGTGETYTLTVYSSSEGVTPGTATVTPVG